MGAIMGRNRPIHAQGRSCPTPRLVGKYVPLGILVEKRWIAKSLLFFQGEIIARRGGGLHRQG